MITASNRIRRTGWDTQTILARLYNLRDAPGAPSFLPSCVSHLRSLEATITGYGGLPSKLPIDRMTGDFPRIPWVIHSDFLVISDASIGRLFCLIYQEQYCADFIQYMPTDFSYMFSNRLGPKVQYQHLYGVKTVSFLYRNGRYMYS